MPSADIPAYDENTPREPSFRNAGTVGMLLFLAALTMLFAASLLAYIMIRVGGPNSPRSGSIQLPGLLWLSTVMVIGVSVALALATRQIREGKHRSYRKSLTAALALAAGFLSVQTPAMISLLAQHQELRATNMRLYGLIFVLILLHALHVLGGMVSLVIVTVKAHRGAYERPAPVPPGFEMTDPGHDPIRHTTLYWHFLDCVWIVMFGVLLVLR